MRENQFCKLELDLFYANATSVDYVGRYVHLSKNCQVKNINVYQRAH